MKIKPRPTTTAVKELRAEIIKSIIAGIASNGLDFLMSMLLLYAEGSTHYDGFAGMIMGVTKNGLPYTPPTSVYLFVIFLASTLAFTVNYLLSVFYVFRYGHIGKRKFGVILFISFAVLSITITLLGSALFHTLLGINLWLVKSLMIVVIFCLNLFVRRKYIFNINAIRDDNAIHLPQNLHDVNLQDSIRGVKDDDGK